VGIASSVLIPDTLEPSAAFDNPFGVDAAILGPVGAVANTLFVTVLLGALLSLILRLHRSRGEERQQIKWFVAVAVFGISSLAGLNIVYSLFAEGNSLGAFMDFLGTFLWMLVPVSLPIAVGIAILKYRLYDIDIIINRTLVYGALTVCIIGIYVLVVGYLGAAFQARGNLAVSIFAAGLVAIMFQPLRERLQRIVNRLTYGERDDPYGVLSRLGRRLEVTIAPKAVLPAIVEDIARALRLPQVAIWLADGETLRLGAAHGSIPASVAVNDARAVEALRNATDLVRLADLDPSGVYRDILTGGGVSLIAPLTHQGELVGPYAWLRAVPAKSSPRPTGDSCATWPPNLARPSMRFSSPVRCDPASRICNARASGSWRPRRRSAAASSGTCTTGSGRSLRACGYVLRPAWAWRKGRPFPCPVTWSGSTSW